MTSGNFSSFPVASIVVDRPNRQRRDLVGIEDLADSIRRIGLIHPLTLQRNGTLRAGERRFSAVSLLGWTHVPVQFVEDLPEDELQLLELEENVRREDITWDDECRAIQRYHDLRAKAKPDWTFSATAEALGFSRRYVEQHYSVADALDKGNTKVLASTKFSTASDIVRRDAERKRDSVKAEILDEAPAVPLLLGDFHAWSKDYKGQPFNLIHCDFPFGGDHSDGGQKMGRVLGHYEDTPDTYWALLETLRLSMTNVVAPSAHLIFWFSMHYYSQTFSLLEGMGWSLEPFPLIWKKHFGTVPDPNRKPFRKYETAFLGSRGDRKIVTSVDNIFDTPGTKEVHMSEKPLPLLGHFLKMVVDETTTFLDPTAGSGNAVKVAQKLGAQRVLGIEKSEEFYQRAREAWGA